MRPLSLSVAMGLAALLALPAGADSLWSGTTEPYFHWFADTKARQVGDVVTILIKEESKATTDLSQSHTKASDAKAAIEELRSLCGINKPKVGAAADEKGLPTVEWNSSRKFDANAKSESKEALELRIGTVVTEVLPNGNLVIEGHREIRHDEDVRLVHIAGIVRPADIAADNTVLSEHIAQARISYEGAGPATRNKRKGWGGRFMDMIWPF